MPILSVDYSEPFYHQELLGSYIVNFIVCTLPYYIFVYKNTTNINVKQLMLWLIGRNCITLLPIITIVMEAYQYVVISNFLVIIADILIVFMFYRKIIYI